MTDRCHIIAISRLHKVTRNRKKEMAIDCIYKAERGDPSA